MSACIREYTEYEFPVLDVGSVCEGGSLAPYSRFSMTCLGSSCIADSKWTELVVFSPLTRQWGACPRLVCS